MMPRLLREIYERECAKLKLLPSDARSRAYEPVAAAMLAAYEAGRVDGGKYGWQPDVGGVATIESNSHRQR